MPEKFKMAAELFTMWAFERKNLHALQANNSTDIVFFVVCGRYCVLVLWKRWIQRE